MSKTSSLLLILLIVLSLDDSSLSQEIGNGSVSQNIISRYKTETDPSTPLSALKEIQLKFNLTGNFKPEELWAGSPKSVWKLDYEIRLSDEDSLTNLQSKVYSKYENSKEISRWKPKANKKFYKKRKKMGLFVAKGKFEKTELLSETNREIIVSIQLMPEVRELLARAENSNEKPSFILNLKGKLIGKDSSLKYNEKYNINFEYPLKFYKSGDSYILYNTFGASINVVIEKSGVTLDVVRI